MMSVVILLCFIFLELLLSVMNCIVVLLIWIRSLVWIWYCLLISEWILIVCVGVVMLVSIRLNVV